jgi:hypothetical protein
MTRIDGAAPSDHEALKKEIKEELKEEAFRRKLVGCGACAVVLLIVIGVPVLLGASALAKTGFVNVPLFSKALYEPSQPLRTVTPLTGTSSEDVMRIAGLRIRYNETTAIASFTLTETELTTLAQNGVRDAPPGSLPIAIRTAQVAVDPDLVEVFLISPRKERDATVRLRFTPDVREGDVVFDVREIVIGSYRVPLSVGNLLFDAFVEPTLRKVFEGAGPYERPVDIEAEDAKLRVDFRPML